MLPWKQWTLFAVCCAVLAALHVVTAAVAVLRRGRLLAWVWRAQSLAALAFMLYMGWALLTSGLYLSGVYETLGKGVSAIMLAAFALVVLVTVPLSCWGLACTGGVRWGRASSAALVVVGALGVFQIAAIRDDAQGVELVEAEALPRIEAALRESFASIKRSERRPRSLMTRRAAECEAPVEGGGWTFFFTFIGWDKRPHWPVTICVQVRDEAALRAVVAELVEKHAIEGFVKIDVLTRRFDLPQSEGFVASMSWRPGLDGACRGRRCLMPWQLFATEALDTHRPLTNLRQVRSGVSFKVLRKLIRKKRGERGAFARIETRGWVLDRHGRLVGSSRRHRPDAVPTPEAVHKAAGEAQGFIIDSQRPDGRFRYILNPISGEVVDDTFSLARQAGTTMALCEIGDRGDRTRETIRRSLDLMAGLERRAERGGVEVGYLQPPDRAIEGGVAIGNTALALVAFLRCRQLVGDGHDALMGRLMRTIMDHQRPRGDFRHFVDGETFRPRTDRGGLLYVDGQAIFALILMEAVASEGGGAWPARAELRDAAERAMTYFGGDYWDHFSGNFFFLEEHWHCLAAAAALGHHRHEGYEDFCLDFIAARSRLQADEASEVHPDYLGGLGYSNLTPPRNTATTGFGEPLAAAILIKRARGLDTALEEVRMERAMGFLMRNQWSEDTCFACSPKVKSKGGFSQTMATLPVRIDYVQHAWAALGHGARVLEHGWTRDMPVRTYGAPPSDRDKP